MDPTAILKEPYARVVVPESDGSFTAEILEFPGCVAAGDTAAEALANLEDIAVDWITATIEQGQGIPDPLNSSSYSGKLVVRMTKGLHKRASLAAEREGVSLNQFIVTCLAECVGERAASRRNQYFGGPLQQNVGVFVFGSGISSDRASTAQAAVALSSSSGSKLITGNPWGSNA